MNDPRVQRLVSALLLAMFCLGQTLAGAAGVRCTDPSGESRIEAVCHRSDVGACVTTACEPADLHDEGSSGATEPCRDEPVGQMENRAKLIPQPLQYAPSAVVAADLPVWMPSDERDGDAGRRPSVRPERERPPDAAERLSTVILLV